MSVIKSFSVGDGDMFYIRHNSPNFSIIDCCLGDTDRRRIVDELARETREEDIRRFLSTHPDDDHIRGLEYLDDRLPISNFYCVKNEATKDQDTPSFERYRLLRDGPKAFHVSKDCRRKWMNVADDERGSAGLSILWPDPANPDYKAELRTAKQGTSCNNMSLIATYRLVDGVRVQWMGDLETTFMETIEAEVELKPVDILFARKSGKVPNSWLDKLKPRIIVLGESPSRHLHYYGGYNTLKQNSAGDVLFDCVTGKVHIYTSKKYAPDADVLVDEGKTWAGMHYLGTLRL